MDEQMMINMITNCSRMEAALDLLRMLMERGDKRDCILLDQEDLNMVFTVAGKEPFVKAKTSSGSVDEV